MDGQLDGLDWVYKPGADWYLVKYTQHGEPMERKLQLEGKFAQWQRLHRVVQSIIAQHENIRDVEIVITSVTPCKGP